MLPSGYLTELESSRYSSAYRHRLGQGLQHLRQWLGQHSITDFTTNHSHRWRDGILAQYVQDCHDSSVP